MYISADDAGWKRARAAQHARKLRCLGGKSLLSCATSACNPAGVATLFGRAGAACVALCVPSLRTDASQLL